MKTKRTLTIAMVLVALAALVTISIFRGTQRVQAQDTVPPPQPDRISFGMVGITRGQTIRLNVVNTNPPPVPDSNELPPSPIRVVLTFLDPDGHRLRSRDGSIIRRVVQLPPGQATFLDLNADDLQVPPPIGDRLQLRAVVNVIPPPQPESQVSPPTPDRIVPSVEVFTNATGRTAFVLAAAPSVRTQAPPQPE